MGGALFLYPVYPVLSDGDFFNLVSRLSFGNQSRQAMAPIIVLQVVHRDARQEAVAYLRGNFGKGYVQGKTTAY